MIATRNAPLPADWRAIALALQCWEAREREELARLGLPAVAPFSLGSPPSPLPETIERLVELAGTLTDLPSSSQVIVSGGMVRALREALQRGTLSSEGLLALAAHLRAETVDEADRGLLAVLEALAHEVANASRPLPPPGLKL